MGAAACGCVELSPDQQLAEEIGRGACVERPELREAPKEPEADVSRIRAYDEVEELGAPGTSEPDEEPACSKPHKGLAVQLPPSFFRTAQLTMSFIKRLREKVPRVGRREVAHPNFSGDWLLHRLEGDPEALLKEVGASWVQRKAAMAMGFGAGRQFVRIEQHPNSIRIETSYRSGENSSEAGWLKPTNNLYGTDGREQESVDPEGRTLRTRVSWDGQVLAMDAERVGSGKLLPSTRRYLQSGGEELVFEQTSSATGTFCRRIYRRHDSSTSSRNPSRASKGGA